MTLKESCVCSIFSVICIEDIIPRFLLFETFITQVPEKSGAASALSPGRAGHGKDGHQTQQRGGFHVGISSADFAFISQERHGRSVKPAPRCKSQEELKQVPF